MNGKFSRNGIYSIDFEDLEAKFKDPANTVMIMCHPHNPIGRVWTRDELERIHALSLQYNVPVISDEIHADLTLSGHQHVSYGTLDPQAIICTSVSKTFNLAGLKISNIIIKDEGSTKRHIKKIIKKPVMNGLEINEVWRLMENGELEQLY